MDEQLWYGKYCPQQLISANGDTEVFLVRHSLLEENRILKRAVKGTGAEQMLRNEAKVLMKVSSPYIPNLLDFLDEEKEVVIIEEFLEGDSLSRLLDDNTHFSPQRIYSLSCSLCYALLALHDGSEGFLHGDVKPANLIVNGDELRLIDFGTAAKIGKESICANSYGTKGFCAPEQLIGELRGTETDIYAVGKIMMLLLERAESANNTEKKLVARLYGVAEKASSELPGDRFESVGEMLVMLEGCRDRKSRRAGQPLNRNGYVCTVGIIGTHHGVGVTHTALSIASYLQRSGKRVAVVELSGQSALDCFGKQKDAYGSSCSYKGLNVFPGADSLLAGIVRNGRYDYCILDLGCTPERRRQELLRCEIKLIVTDSAPWKAEKRAASLKMLDELESLSGWWLLVNFSENTLPKDCRRLPLHVDSLRFSPNPFEPSGQNERLFGKILPAFRHTSISGLPLSG